MRDWSGRVALVTGASSGIGAAVTARLARSGLRVVATARRAERLDRLRADLEGEGEVLPLPADLRDPDAVVGLFDRIREVWGGVDVLVNNAGLGRHASMLEADLESWREMLDVNVLALALCTREAVRDMRRRDAAGHVVHISSMSGHRVPPAIGGGFYAATKHAVDALTEAWRQELRAIDSPIRVSAVSPGFVETEFAEKSYGSRERAEELFRGLDVLQPDDIAEAVWYALSQPAHVQVHDVLVRPTGQKT